MRPCATWVDAGTAWQGSGHGWAGWLGLLLIPTLFSPPNVFLLLGLVFMVELAEFACYGLTLSRGRRTHRLTSPRRILPSWWGQGRLPMAMCAAGTAHGAWYGGVRGWREHPCILGIFPQDRLPLWVSGGSGVDDV